MSSVLWLSYGSKLTPFELDSVFPGACFPHTVHEVSAGYSRPEDAGSERASSPTERHKRTGVYIGQPFQ